MPEAKRAVARAEPAKAGARARTESEPEPPANPLWQRLAMRIQPKLVLGSPDDESEREADRVAAQITGVPAPRVQRSCAACAAAGAPCPKCREEDAGGLVQRSATVPGGEAAVPDSFTPVPGTGRPLEPSTRADMEGRFGHDLGHVRVHTDGPADESAQAIQAHAYTVGQHVVFGAGEYAPGTSDGRWLLAHELVHVLQQRGSGPRVQRQAAPTCPRRPSGERAQSRTPPGFLPVDVVYSASANRLDIMDFGVGDAALPAGVVDTQEWQRTMAYIVGDPSAAVSISGFTDCAGSDGENFTLRQNRTQAVKSAMPAVAQSRILFSYVGSTTTFLAPNDTAENRARNRAVRVTFASLPPLKIAACDRLTRAANLDEFLFLVRCLESRLNLTAPADAPRTLSALRQIYYGTPTWSESQNRVWGFVIPTTPWAPGTDPAGQLGAKLSGALHASQVVEGIDVGHVMTGLDAMLHPHTVILTASLAGGRINPGLDTDLANEEWATWAGDIGSAAMESALDTVYGRSRGNFDFYFTAYASDRDLLGNIDSFAIRAGMGGAAPAAQLMTAINLNAPLSEILLQYYRLRSTPVGQARGRAVRNFVEAYGGTIAGNAITNGPALAARLRPSVEKFASLYGLEGLINRGDAPPGSPPLGPLMVAATDEMMQRFVNWLAARL